LRIAVGARWASVLAHAAASRASAGWSEDA
jgi:hypothetical protein